MKIATHNAEKLLLADLREARVGSPNHRCLFLRLSNISEQMSTWLPRLERSVRYTIQDYVQQIYMTHDGDVFITGWGLTQKSVQDFIFELSEVLSPKSLVGLATLYEIGIHWAQLEKIISDKIYMLDKKSETKKAKYIDQALDKLSGDKVLSMADSQLIKTITQRRIQRQGIEILIVEDDKFSQTLINKSLDEKYKRKFADDGRAAIFGYIKHAPDIMFLDIELPDINGHDVLKKIKTIDPQAYVVMFSGNGDRENIMKALDLGAQGFVGKPFAKEKLIQYIEKSPFVIEKRYNTQKGKEVL